MDRRVCLLILFLTCGLLFVPAAKVAYFDPDGRVCSIARSEPVTLNITEARPSKAAVIRVVGADLLRLQGIVSNYDGPEVLIGRCSSLKCLLTSRPAACGLAFPPCLFLLLAGLKRMKRRRMSAEFRSRAARSRFEKIVKGIAGRPAAGPDQCGQLLYAVRSFLSDKLSVCSNGFTCTDFDTLLRGRGVDVFARARLGEIWVICERERFGGGAATALQWRELVAEALDIVRSVDTQVR